MADWDLNLALRPEAALAIVSTPLPTVRIGASDEWMPIEPHLSPIAGGHGSLSGTNTANKCCEGQDVASNILRLAMKIASNPG
jgi:hypothetical protein